MVKHLTEFKRTREEHKYQMKLIREIGFNIFDSTGDLEKLLILAFNKRKIAVAPHLPRFKM